MTRYAFFIALALTVVACGDDPDVIVDVDAGADTGVGDGGRDLGPADSGPADSGPADSGPADSGPPDTGPVADIVVDPLSELTTTESGGTATFTAVLTVQPSADVTFVVVSSNEAEGTVSPASLTFTSLNWNMPQTVTVTGIDDLVADGPQEYGILVRVNSAGDPAYEAVEDKHVEARNVDNDTPGITVVGASLSTSEDGTTATGSIVLNSQPAADVTIALLSDDLSEGLVTPATVTFTTSNWGTPQAITFVGVDDATRDGDGVYIINTEAAVSADPGYNGLNADDYTLTNTDNEIVPSTQTAYIKAPNADMYDTFGLATRLSDDGDTMVVGASAEGSNATGVGGDQTNNSATYSGAAYVFVRSGGHWALQAYIKASNTEMADTFGYQVAISGDGNTIAVTANDEDSAATGIDGNQADNSALSCGAVYIFVRSGVTWTQQAYVKPSNSHANEVFGKSISLSHDGNRLAVGAQGENGAATGVGGDAANLTSYMAGAVFVFDRSGTTWMQSAYIKSSNSEGSDYFGSFLALSSNGTTLAVTAFGEDSAATGVGGDQASNATSGSGAAYVFRHSGADWVQEAYIKTSNPDVADFFGWGASLSGDGSVLAVGAPGESSNATGVDGDQSNDSLMNAGAVYVFTRASGVWTQMSYLKASNTDAGDGFGRDVSLSLDGNVLAVGAPNERSNADGTGGDQSDDSTPDSGAAYIFNRGGGTWAQNAYIKSSNSDEDDLFAYRVCISGDGHTFAAGSYGESSSARTIDGDQSDNSAPAAGATYVFDVPVL